MSYRPGIGPGLTALGWFPGDPRIVCDGCSKTFTIKHIPPTWFLEGKAPRGWKRTEGPDGLRRDWCQVCKIGGAK